MNIIDRGWNKTVLVALLISLALPFLCGCGGGGGSTSTSDISGDWEITEIPDPNTLTSSPGRVCNIHNQSTRIYTVTQAGDQVTITDPEGQTLNGTMNNGLCTFSGHFIEGTENIYIDGEISFSGSSLSGSGSFRWEEGSEYCQWEEDFVGTRVTSGNCISVAEGGWEFEWRYRGTTFLEFTDGDLKQSGCNVSYDDDNIFSGPLEGNRWSGENTVEQFRFSGTFSGSPATSFTGSWEDTSGSGYTGEMYGVRGALP